MNGFFGMTVDDKHTCSSPVDVVCESVDVVVDRFNFFIFFLSRDVPNKVRVKVISHLHTVLILLTQGHVFKDLIKDFSVASKVISGIDHRHLDQMSICLESQSVFSASYSPG